MTVITNYNNKYLVPASKTKLRSNTTKGTTNKITDTTIVSSNFKPIATIAGKVSSNASEDSQKQVKSNSSATSTMVEGVQVEGYETLTTKQKRNLENQLKAYQTKLKKLALKKDGSFEKLIETAFGREKIDNPEQLKVFKQKLASLKADVLSGKWKEIIPKIKLGDQSSFDTARSGTGQKVDAMGAFIKGSEKNGGTGTGTIILNKSLLDGPISKDGQTINFQDILAEEIGHAWDVKLNNSDSEGDEGEAISILLKMTEKNRQDFYHAVDTMESTGTNVDFLIDSEKKISADLQLTLDAFNKAKAENDNGTMTITNADGTKTEIEVEFGFLSSVCDFVKDTVKSVVKKTTEFYTAPLRIMADIVPGPFGDIVDDALDLFDDVVDATLEEMEKLADKAEELANKAWKKFEKNVLQSKWLGPVLMVMSFIPVLGTVAMVAQLALAAYQVGKGLETGNMAMVMGGVMSAVGGATAGGMITGATATTIATAAKTGYAAYNGVQAAKNGNWAGVATAAVSIAGTTGAIDAGTASNINQGINIEQAIENKDYVGALTSSVALAGNTGIIEKNTAKNIQQTVAFGKAIDDGDASAAIRLGTSYAGTTDWAKENPETYSAIETGSSIYSVIEDDEMTEEQKAAAISKTLYDQKLISKTAYNNLNKSTELYEIVKGNKTDAEKAAAVSNYLYDQGLINEELNKNINTGSDIYGVVKSDKTSAEKAEKVSEYLYDAGAIEQETYDTVQTGLGAYNIAKGDGNSAEITQKMNDYLFEKGVIDFDTHSTINTAANTFDGTKNDNEKAKAYLELLQKFKIIDPETQDKLNELISASEGNADEIIAKITSDESTLLDSETKKTVKESYELYAQGEETYNTIKNGNSSEQAKLFTESAVNLGMIDQNTANELYANYQDGKSIYDTITEGNTKERVELLVNTGIIDKEITEELYAFYDDGKKAYDTITNGSTSDRVKLLINSGVIDKTTAKELYAYYEVGKATYDNATNSVAA